MKILYTDELTPGGLSTNDAHWVYNGLDCCITLEILNKIKPLLSPVTADTYAFSLAMQAPILEMSTRGLRVDQARRKRVLAEYRDDIERVAHHLTSIIRDGIGVEVNWRSPAQLKRLLYEVLGLPVIKKRSANGTYAPTADREALEQLSVNLIAEPICNRLLLLRDLDKKRMFLETEIDPDGRMRCNFNIAGTVTGRLASSMSDFGTGTNLQNVDTELRSVFIADPGMKFLNLDLQQADARNVGAICWNLFRDGAYLDACESGDLHTTVCRMAWTDLAWGEPGTWRDTADQPGYRGLTYRDLAKRLGHGTNYLGTPATMAKHTKVAKALIEDFQARYFKAFPAIRQWHDWVRQQLVSTSTLTTLLGRQRVFFSRPQEATTLREAVAYEPQSLTGDEINRGILQLRRNANATGRHIELLVQVHDSILLQYRETDEADIVPWALRTLQVPIDLKHSRTFTVPTDAKVGWNWGDADVANPLGLAKWKGSDSRKR